MRATTDTLLQPDVLLLDRAGELYRSTKRNLYARIAADGGKAKSY
ncbi:hypothetical protein [Paraburkholderia elongata]|nr:hypothetical protein [Paraburkholderia elongata]